ncbi:hypothetical protein L7F22_012722 [Adiantum nelumboides]|nr:hypothetical protein [Adiantum nelumboides]
MWVRIQLATDRVIHVALCYFPPRGSHFADHTEIRREPTTVEETPEEDDDDESMIEEEGPQSQSPFSVLSEDILHYAALGEILLEFAKAIESYKEYLILCIKNGDKEGEAIAYNFIACSLQEEQDLKLADTLEISSEAAIQYEKAEEYHKLHAEIANYDGKFLAHSNLGLLYANMGKWTDAAISHQNALKYATLTERPDRQGVAVGNLGFTLFRQKEWVTAKACMVKYLQICNALKDVHGQGRAYYILGSIASQRKWYEEAIKEFEASLKAAKLTKDAKLETLSKIMLGVAQGDNLLKKEEASEQLKMSK